MIKPVLKHYAQAMFEIARDDKKIIPYNEDMLFLDDVFSQAPELGKLLDSPMVSDEDKKNLIDSQLALKLNKATCGFLKILTRKKATHHFHDIYVAYLHLYHRSIGVLEGRIYTAFPLSDEAIQKLEDIYSKKYEKKVFFTIHIDKKVIAGMKIFIDDTLYDYSIDSKINNIKTQLLYKKSL
ncbi:MAG: ATP synthase F1 subunit delta [Bacilli bacterium]